MYFLGKYNEETESFYSLYENIDDLKQGSKLLMHYVDESLKGENSMGGRQLKIIIFIDIMSKTK